MVGYSCYAAQTCTHSANGAALGPVLDMPVVVQRHVHSRQLCRGAEAVSLGPDCSENHSDSLVAVH